MEMDTETLKQLLSGPMKQKESKVKETLKNAKLAKAVGQTANQVTIPPDMWGTEIGKHVYAVASRFTPEIVKHRPFFLSYVEKGKVNISHYSYYLDYLKKHRTDDTIDSAEFEKCCGIDLTLSEEEIATSVDEAIKSCDKVVSEKQWGAKGAVVKHLKGTNMKFADSKLLNDKIEAAFTAKFGSKADQKKLKKTKPKTQEQKKKQAAAKAAIDFHEPKDNVLNDAHPELLKAHLEATGGKVVTRFPPEPNGYLHLGHCKAMYMNFGYAKRKNGKCYLRFDDTNPETEKQEYIDTIIDNCMWLGHKPCDITYSSDYFPQLYEFAVKLIKADKAYVCHLSGDQISEDRTERHDSPYRNRPIEESLKIFDDMRKGLIDEGAAVLRLKINMKSDNPNMRDPIAYRIKFLPHPRTGNKWCVYPTYDYTHCIVDSLENISHSICTLEFTVRRESYEWLNHAIPVYCPQQIELARLNVEACLMSKRKLLYLVQKGIVRGWDDPRLPTINGLRRRGFTANALNSFCEKVGFSMRNIVMDYSLLEDCTRKALEPVSTRAMAVFYPVKVILENYEDDKVELLDVPNIPGDKTKGFHKVPLSKVIYIDSKDFRKVDSAEFYRLAPGKEVGLLHYPTHNIACKSFKEENGVVVEITAELVEKKKVKAHIHWVAQPSPGKEPLTAEVRLYKPLFKIRNAADIPKVYGNNWLRCVNKNAETVIKAFVDPSIEGVKALDLFQFERKGFFCVDADTTEGNIVFNQTVALRDTFKKVEQKKKK